MSEDILVIDTNSPTRVVEQPVIPLTVYGEGYPRMTMHDALKSKTEEFDITQISQPEVQNFIKRMKMTMQMYGGLGLSATQCGVRFRMFVMGAKDNLFVCINPKIVSYGEDVTKKKEGCLSFPGLYLNVPRFETIIAEYYDENSQLMRREFSGITAQVYQHELDHLNGILYTRHVKPLTLRLAREKQAKMIKKLLRANKR